MVFFWRKKTKQKPQKKSAKKPRSKTFILEEIISPGAYCPAPLDDSLLNHPIFGLFTEPELITTILGTDAPPNIADIDTEILVQDYWEKLNEYFQENPSEADAFDINNLSTWPTLEALINPGQPSVEIPDVGGAVDTLPPPVTVPVDPPRNNPGSGTQDPVIPPPQPPTLVNAISDITLTPETSSQTIDISDVFATPDGEQLKYEVISNNRELLNLNLENNQLSIEALPKTGESQITIQATTDAGGVAAHTFKVFNNYVPPKSAATINNGLTELQNVIDANPDDLLASLDTDAAQTALETLATELESNFDNIFNAIQQPETLTKAGVSPEAVATLEKLLANREVGAALGLPTSVESALASDDFRIWDNYLINATEAASILLPDAPQTNVAFLDFADGHGENVTEVFESVNPNAEYQRLSINNGNWAQQLVQYVDNLKAAGEERGIVNLSFDLSQVDEQGRVTTRYDLTEAEQLAIQYARDNNVLLVAASGNTGGEMSALGKAAEQFDNIITVGAVNKLEEVADYSSRGDTLTLVAPGGQYENDPNAFVGTSRATSYVTGAASLVWAANPELSYQQVKELLTLTAKDLGAEGWDAETGAGLLDVTEAVLMAGLVAPEAVVRFGDVDISAFSGAGRVDVDVRAASPETEAAIQDLTDTQNQLFEQWQVLRYLGNDDVSLEELQNEIASRKSEALDSYRDVDTAAAISLVKNQESLAALGLAREHYQIELSRLEGLLQRQGELQDGLVALTGERNDLLVANEEQLRVLEEAIARTEQELDDARKKLQYQLVDPDTLVANAEAVQAEIAKLEAKIQQYQQQSAALKATANNYYGQANQYRQQHQHYINLAHPHRPRYSWCGHSLGGNPGLYNHYRNIANQAGRNANSLSWQGDVFQVNHGQLEQLNAQMGQQNQALSDYEKLLESNNQKLSTLTGNPDDGNQILEALQKQAAEKTQQAEKYWQQAALAEQRRKQSQDKANWHNSMYRRWQVVGHRPTGRCGWNRAPIHGWRHYPEHIAPRNQAQQQANNAEAERRTFEQWARQAQAEADALNQQATALAQRVGDWPQLKRGIEYEINAKQQQLQAEKDLLALQTPVQQQQLEALDLKINQATDELQKLETEQLPEQQQKADATEERLKKTQEEVEGNQTQRSQTQTDLQNFLETYGYLLPYQERRTAVQKQIQQLTEEITIVQQLLLQLQTEVANNPNNNLTSQLESTQNYLEQIEQQLAYAKVQEEQLNLSAPDSPQRLAIGNLIDDLAKRQQNLPETNTLPLQEYIDFLRGVENRNNNLLNGFDDLEERLTTAQTQQTAANETLQRLQNEYRDLGLAKADIEAEKLVSNQIQKLQEHEASLQLNISENQPNISNLQQKQQIFQDIENIQPNATLEEAIALKDSQIYDTKTAISQTQDTINSLENDLAATKQAKSDKEVEIAGQEGAIAQTETDLEATQVRLGEIADEESVLQSYRDQIQAANATTDYFEQQRQNHQNQAQYWQKQIYRFNERAYLRYNRDVYHHFLLGWLQSGWQHYVIYGRREGRLPNPLAKIYRDRAQAAANNATQQRNLAAQQAQQLTTALQPQIEAKQEDIAGLQEEKQNLEAEKQNLQTQLSNQQQELQNLQSELGEIEQNIGNIESDIATNKQKVEELDAQLLKESSEKIYLQDTLAEIDQRIEEKESEISDKYEEIELTEKYARHVNAEVDRLENRLDLINQADALETEYQNQQDNWQNALDNQIAATEEFLATRKAGEDERKQLLSLQSQLADTQTQLATAQQQQALLRTEVQTAQKDLQLTQLQLGNQHLLLQSLQGQDEPLRSAEAYYYNQAQYHRQRMWYYNGGQFVYHSGHAAAYRANLQKSSRFAQQRNENWSKRQETHKKIQEFNQAIATQTANVASKEQELAKVTPEVTNLTAKAAEIESQIPPLVTALEPLQQVENEKLADFQNAVQQTETASVELAQTTKEQAAALNHLISFGVLGTESDVDFFATQVEPKVNEFIQQLQNRSNDLGSQADTLGNLIADWQSELDNTTDTVSRQALTDLIAETIGQQKNLLQRQQENQEIVTELSDRLTEATVSLENLRQQQELEIRSQLNSNDERLEALNRQLETETAAEKALNEDTVLAYAQLNDQVRADLTASATQWVSQLQEGHQQTKEIGESQQNLSQLVDDLIEYIEDNLADVDGERDRNLADLRDAITTLGVVAPRRDELAAGETALKQGIEKLKQWIEQDAKLWSEIAPIAERYGAESQELEEYREESQLLAEAQNILKPFFDLEQKKEQRFNRSRSYRYFENPATGNRYFFTRTVNTWHAAQNEARRAGGNLVTIRNHAEQNFLRLKVGRQSVWMGLTDAGREGRWRWVSGEPVTYANFSPGQPDNAAGFEHWTEFMGQAGGRWNDVNPWDGIFQKHKRGLVEISVRDLTQQQQQILDNLLQWSQQKNGLNKISDMARQIIASSSDRPQHKQAANNLELHLQHFENLMRTGNLKGAAKHLKSILDYSQSLLRPTFLQENPNNGSAIDVLQAETQEESNKYSSRLAQLKAAEAQNNAQAAAAIAQADWYEKRAAYHWQRSRKNGPTWQEWRQTWKRGKSGKKEHWVLVTHVDHDWIIWDTYTKYTQQLRQQAVNQLVATDNQSQQQDRLQPLAEQWADAHNSANAAEAPITASRNLVEVLETAREQIPAAQEQLELLEDLLPEIEQKLAEAQKEADDYNAKVLAEWEEHDENVTEYINTVEDILERRGELNKQSQELQNQLADTEKWVEQQTVALDVETEQVDNLRQQLIADGEALAEKIAVATGNELTELQTKQAQLQDALGLLDNKATVLQQQQTAFSQKRTLLTAENEVILAEQRLLDAYLTTPDSDLEQLREQLADARAALAEAQRLAEQAEASSQALTAPLQEVQNDLLAQNDEHLKAAKEHQQILKELLEATELNANYTLEAAKKQQQVNDLEFQILQRLQEVTAAGNQEAKHLLEVATHNDVASAAEIYYRDYSDLASDKRSSSAGGLAKPEDRILADSYYREMLTHRQLQQRAQAQANHFQRIKDIAQGQMNTLSDRQKTVAEELQRLQKQIVNSEAEKERKQQELAIAQASLESLTRLRNQTEQTFVNLVNIEQLNLAQAELEQQIAAQRNHDIEQAVQERIEREQIELERQRLEAQFKLEQLRQVQAEDNLLKAINNARNDIGLEEIEDNIDEQEWQPTQLATTLTNMSALNSQNAQLPQQYQFPPDVQSLLDDVRNDIYVALQGKHTDTARANLESALATLIIQGNQYQYEIQRIVEAEKEDAILLAEAEEDIQTAAQKTLKLIEESEELQKEKQIITPLAMESLAKVAHAKNAVKISFELAKAAKDVLNEILDHRKKERKARKKAFWEMVVNIVTTVLNIIGLIFPKIKLITTLISTVISSIWAAINGDWMGAIFGVVMSVADFATAKLSNALKAVAKCPCETVWGMTQKVAKNVLKTIKSLQKIAKGAYKGIKSFSAQDEIKGVLEIIGGLAGAVTTGFGDAIKALPAGDVLLTVIKEFESTPLKILNSVRVIQNGDWFNGINQILDAALSFGYKLTTGPDLTGDKKSNGPDGKPDYQTIPSAIFGTLGLVNSTAGSVVNRFFREGGLEGWLKGLGEIGGTWRQLPDLLNNGIKTMQGGNLTGGIGSILNSAVSVAKDVGNWANTLENVSYSALAATTVIKGATQDLKTFFDSFDPAKDYLIKGWKDDVEKFKLKGHFKHIFKELKIEFKDDQSIKEYFDTLVDWAKTSLKGEIQDSILDLISTLTPWEVREPRPLPATP